MLAPRVNNLAPQNQVQKLVARVFVETAVTRPTGDQKIYVAVQDQTLRPVAGAAVKLTIVWLDGWQDRLDLTTDRNGLTAAKISYEHQPPGELVILTAEASYQGLTTGASGSFRIWH